MVFINVSKKNGFLLSAISDIDFKITHSKYDKRQYNHNESHIHDEYEIYVNLSGEVAFEVENKIYPVSRGSVVLTKPHEYHHCIILREVCHEFYWITFSADKCEFLESLFEREDAGNLIILGESELDALTDIFSELLIDQQSELKRRIDFLRIMDILSSQKQIPDAQKSLRFPQDVKRALAYMDDHITEEITAEVLCRVAICSINTLERHFSNSLGLTPFAVLRKKRLILSTRYLRQGESVAFSATNSGFSDYSNYIQLFKKHFGITPFEYKKRFAHKT